jgi:hypothetical protein
MREGVATGTKLAKEAATAFTGGRRRLQEDRCRICAYVI